MARARTRPEAGEKVDAAARERAGETVKLDTFRHVPGQRRDPESYFTLCILTKS